MISVGAPVAGTRYVKAPRASAAAEAAAIGATWGAIQAGQNTMILLAPLLGGFIGPIATKMNQTYEEDAQFYAIIRDCLVAYLQGHSAPIVVEPARRGDEGDGRISVPTG